MLNFGDNSCPRNVISAPPRPKRNGVLLYTTGDVVLRFNISRENIFETKLYFQIVVTAIATCVGENETYNMEYIMYNNYSCYSPYFSFLFGLYIFWNIVIFSKRFSGLDVCTL